MPPTKPSIFTQKELPKRDLRLRLDASLLDEHQAITQQLSKLAPDLEFDLNACVETSIRKAIGQARREINSLSAQQGKVLAKE